MQRTPEPELMDDAAQAEAYAVADFSDANHRYVEHVRAHLGPDFAGRAVDLGCGPADICFRLLALYPEARIDGVDGAPEMLAWAERRKAEGAPGTDRLRLIQATLPTDRLEDGAYDAVLSNSLLHHLHDPAHFWDAVRRSARPGAHVVVMDLFRPESDEAARALVEQYAEGEREQLRQDFYHSLHAAFRPVEIREQLEAAGLRGLDVQAVSDRHVLVAGRLQA